MQLVRTTEPVADWDGMLWPAGTEATLVGDATFAPQWGGQDFKTATGAILWSLTSSQYELIAEEGR